MFARTKRLFLRPPWPEDVAAYHAVHDDWDVVKNLGTAPWPFTLDDARDRIAKAADIPQHEASCVIFLHTDQGPELVGSIGFGRWNDRVRHPEIGYSIARSHWGKGIAVEAGEAILATAFLGIGHPLIGASHFVDNPNSGKVLRRLGFEPTGAIVPYPCRARGCDVDSVEYVLTRERWLQRNGAYREAA
jgi:RimJ/RimL family protein N-acetyltransferase